jgi:WD40 repeat protein
MFSLRRICVPFAVALLLAVCGGCHEGIAWLPDSSGFVYTGGDKGRQLLLFDVKTKTSTVLVKDVGGPAWPAVSPDGECIAVARREYKGEECWLTVRVYDRQGRATHRSKALLKTKTPAGVYHFKGEAILPLVGWSPRGDRLLLGNFDSTALYDVKAGRAEAVDGALLRVGHDVVRPDGKGFLTLTRDAFVFTDWDRKARKIKRPKAETSSGGPIFSASQMTPTLEALLLMSRPSRWDGTTALSGQWRVDSAKLECSEKEGGRIEYPLGVTLTPGGAAHDVDVQVSREGQKKPRTLLRQQPARCFPSPDGKWVAVGWVASKAVKRLVLLDADGEVAARLPAGRGDGEHEVLARLPATAKEARLLAFSPDSKHLTVLDAGGLTRWDLAADKADKRRTRYPARPALARSFKASTGVVALSGDGRFYAAVDRPAVSLRGVPDVLLVWDVASGKRLAARQEDDTVTALAFSADGASLAACYHGISRSFVRVWDLKSRKLRCKLDVPGDGEALAFSPDDKILRVVGNRRGVLEMHSFDLENPGRPARLRLDDEDRQTRRLAPADRFLITYGSGIRVWDLATAKQTAVLSDLDSNPEAAAFSTDGRLLATSGAEEVSLWDARSGKAVVAYWNFLGDVKRLAFSADGKLLACAGEEAVEVWKVRADKE